MNAIKTLSVVTLASLSLTAAACKKDEAKEGGSAKPAAGDKGGGKGAAPAPKVEYKKVGGLGLEIEVPADVTIDDNTSGAGFPMATVWTWPTLFVQGPGDLSPVKPDLDGAKAEIQKDPNPFKTFTKEEKTDTGWHLEFELESMLDKKPVYGVQIRTTIDGQPYDCGSNTSSPAERDAVIAFCRTLRRAS